MFNVTLFPNKKQKERPLASCLNRGKEDHFRFLGQFFAQFFN